MGQESADLLLACQGRIVEVVEEEEALDPVGVGLLGSRAVVTGANGRSDSREQPRQGSRRARRRRRPERWRRLARRRPRFGRNTLGPPVGRTVHESACVPHVAITRSMPVVPEPFGLRNEQESGAALR